MNQSMNSGSKSLKVALIFCIALLLIIFVGGTIRFISILVKGNFDGHHRFTMALLVAEEKKNNQLPMANKALILSFAPDTKSITVLRLSKANMTQESFIALLGIPIDGVITVDPRKIQGIEKYLQKDSVASGQELQALLQTLMLHYNQISTNVTIVDLTRLWFFVKGESSRSFAFTDLTIGKKGMDELVIDRLSATLFGDEAVQEEKVSIHIVNGTGISGLGTKVARIINNMGGNVVVVSTADASIPTGEIVYSETSYTLDRLTKFLEYKTIKMEKPGVSDIIIRLGKNGGKKGLFE